MCKFENEEKTRLLYLGGKEEYIASTNMYEIDKKAIKLADMSTGRCDFGMTSWIGNIAVAGGTTNCGEFTDSIELFTGKDPQSGTWR